MANNLVLIMGESGTGKSTAIRTLNPAETYIINVLDKPLPFKGYKKLYKGGKGGNYFGSDNADKIRSVIQRINRERPEIKNIIIDDFQYIMANAFMRKATEKGFDKFVEIGQDAWEIIDDGTKVRGDLYIFILSHTEADANSGTVKIKTIGKMLDEKIVLEGMFTVVLHSLITNKQYKFLTQHDGTRIAKSPMGMFERAHIDNDLQMVREKMRAYAGDDEDDTPPPPKNTATQPTQPQAPANPTPPEPQATTSEQAQPPETQPANNPTSATATQPAAAPAAPVNDTQGGDLDITEAYLKIKNVIYAAVDTMQLSKDFTKQMSFFNKFKGDEAKKRGDELKDMFSKRIKELPNPQRQGK